MPRRRDIARARRGDRPGIGRSAVGSCTSIRLRGQIDGDLDLRLGRQRRNQKTHEVREKLNQFTHGRPQRTQAETDLPQHSSMSCRSKVQIEVKVDEMNSSKTPVAMLAWSSSQSRVRNLQSLPLGAGNWLASIQSRCRRSRIPTIPRRRRKELFGRATAARRSRCALDRLLLPRLPRRRQGAARQWRNLAGHAHFARPHSGATPTWCTF